VQQNSLMYTMTSVVLRNICPSMSYRTLHLSSFPMGSLAHIYGTRYPPCRFLKDARLFSVVRQDKSLILPRSCPGCGAFTQFTIPEQAGFYDFARKAVQAFVAWSKRRQTGLQEPRRLDPAVDLTQQPILGELNCDQGVDPLTGL
jgi:hypothetical protein